MNTSYKILTGLVLTAAVFLGGFYAGKGDVQVEVQERIIEKEGKTVTIVKDHVVTVTKIIKPDGTIEETTKTEDKSKDKTKEVTVVDKDKQKTITPVLARYSLGLFGSMRVDKLSELPKPSLGISAGMRTVGDVWVKLYSVPQDKSIAIGVEVQI